MPHRARRPGTGPESPTARTAPGDIGAAWQTIGVQLATGEQLVGGVRGAGAMLFVTDQRLVVARDAAERRPRSGVQSFPLDMITHVRLEPGVPPSGRIAVWVGPHEALSIFFDAHAREGAEDAVGLARGLIARRRRERRADARRART